MNIYLCIINSKRNECAKISPNSSFKIFLKKNLQNETDNLQNLLAYKVENIKLKCYRFVPPLTIKRLKRH